MHCNVAPQDDTGHEDEEAKKEGEADASAGLSAAMEPIAETDTAASS